MCGRHSYQLLRSKFGCKQNGQKPFYIRIVFLHILHFEYEGTVGILTGKVQASMKNKTHNMQVTYVMQTVMVGEVRQNS